jgi:nucleoside-diphosphate-sugar epimerase
MQRENSISYRLATVFGMSPRMRTDLLVNDLTYRAVNDGYVIIFEGHFKRNYIHVRDVCEAFLHAVHQFEEMKGQIYNVGLSSANVSKLDLCDIIKKHIPNFTVVEGDIKKDPDQRNYIVSNEKLEATGWYPYHTLDDGVEELIKGYTYLKNNIHGNV